MIDNSINLLEEIDSASQIHVLQRGDIDALMLEFATRITATLKIERMSVWLFNEKRDAIISMGEYDTRTEKIQKESVLLKKDFPKYFQALEENKIILAPNIRLDPKTKEFTELYSIPNDIISLMDIPLRIMGELVGVMCFEKTGNELRIFSYKEQTFAFALATVFASNLEARHRRAAQHKLEQLIKEKELLIREINHRVKNNFTILISLLRLSKNQGKTTDAKVLLDEYEQRIISMMKMHDLLYQNDNYVHFPVAYYLEELVKEFKNSHPEFQNKISSKINDIDFHLDSRMAINLGLVITEIFLNSMKYAFLKQDNIEFFLEMEKSKEGKHIIKVGNSGIGFDFETLLKEQTLGLSIIKDLAEEICESVSFPNEKESVYELRI